MIDFKSKKVNVLSYFLVSFIASFFAPATYDNTILAIAERIGYFIGWIFWGVSISAIIFLIRLIGNRSNKFDYFMNILWCSTIASIIIGTAGILWKSTSYNGSVMPHIFTALAYNIVTIAVAAFLFYKRRQGPDNGETPISSETQADVKPQIEQVDLAETEAPQDYVESSSSMKIKKNEIEENPHYFYAQGTNPVGPLSLEELLHSNIDAETLVWKTGMKDWKQAKCFPELHSHIDMITGTEAYVSSPEKHEKPNEDQILNDRTEEQGTSDKNVDESVMEDLSYYYAEGSTPIGPLSLKTLIQTNINSETLIWKIGMESWKPARCFPELKTYITRK